MRYSELAKIKGLSFTPKDVAAHLGISHRSANITCSRYVKSGLLIRLKRDIYAIAQKWETLEEEDLYRVANLLQVPSYISLTTALSFYGISTQIQRGYYESISLKRTKEVNIKDSTFLFTKLDRRLYGGFGRKNGYFLASPEKALLDAMYLASLKRYNLDVDAIDFTKVDTEKIRELIKKYPEKVKKMWGNYVESVQA